MFTLDTSVVVTALPKNSGVAALLRGGAVLGAERLHPGLRRPAAARRAHGRHLRPSDGSSPSGIGVFTAASLLAGLAPTSEVLLVGRAVQGVAAAVAAPSTLALLLTTFKEPRPRARAIALYSSVSSGGSSVGLVHRWAADRRRSRGAGGCSSTCRSGLRSCVLAPRYLPDTERHPGRFDLMGAATSTLGMTALVYGFVRAASEWLGQ